MAKLFTIGHSTHTLQEFLTLLRLQKITHIVDVRTIPKSRYVPWFNQDALRAALQKVKISYTHFLCLGGLRKSHKDSINQGWRNKSFRGFADYMQTPEFYKGLKQLNLLVKQKKNVAIMCAEAVPWRCHRSLIADAEIVRGITVIDIISSTAVHLHTLTSFAVVDRTKKPIRIFYP